MAETKTATLAIEQIKANPRNARKHSKKQIQQIANSIVRFGFINPVIVDENLNALAGHGRLAAARLLGLKSIPVIIVSGLSEAERRFYALTDNKLTDNSSFDRSLLAAEFCELGSLLESEGLDFELTGFAEAERDNILVDLVDPEHEPADLIPAPERVAVTRASECWILGDHRIACGDARIADAVETLMGAERAAMAFLDPPFNRKSSAIGGRGATKHPDFLVGSGELSSDEFASFLTEAHTNVANVCVPGALVYSCMDWRGMREMLAAGSAFSELKNLIVWHKTNPGQGSLYRSHHELIFLFKVGGGPHRNNIELGVHGRNRSTIWTYSGVNTFRAGRMDDLRCHPTVKPVALVADAMRDCTRRGDIVLDVFLGSGTTVLAAEKVGRRGYGLEIDPYYADVAIRRWQSFTKRDAVLAGTGETFTELTALRTKPNRGRS